MSTLDITIAISGNNIKNGASLLNVTKGGSIVSFDNSKDTENNLSVFNNLTNNRFDDIQYYVPHTSPS